MKKDQAKPTYYAVINAKVRYDNRLTANAKLLYGEITCLTYKIKLLYLRKRKGTNKVKMT